MILLNIFKMFIIYFERKRECTSSGGAEREGERERERERERGSQAGYAQLAQSPVWGLNSQTVR